VFGELQAAFAYRRAKVLHRSVWWNRIIFSCSDNRVRGGTVSVEGQIKITVRVGEAEVSYEGPETFLRKDLSTIVKVLKKDLSAAAASPAAARPSGDPSRARSRRR
jgi:hypothetical protein